jgi:hypothetical protein
MSEEQRYKKIAELLLGRLITLQREFNNVAEVIEESCEKHQISMYIEIGDFIPLMELADSLGLSDENDESKMYDDIYYLVEKEKDSDSKVEKFFKKYIKNN